MDAARGLVKLAMKTRAMGTTVSQAKPSTSSPSKAWCGATLGRRNRTAARAELRANATADCYLIPRIWLNSAVESEALAAWAGLMMIVLFAPMNAVADWYLSG